jgi:hypothetical protein
MTEPSVNELCTDLIAWAHDRKSPCPGEPPVFRWERWIREDPERGWAVLQELVNRAPRDAEVMFQAAFRASQMLCRDFQRYREPVVTLLEASSYLDELLGPEVFMEAEYAPRTIEPEHLAQVWLRHSRNGNRAKWPEQLDREDPELRIRLALEIIERGPLRGLDLDDVEGPLLDVLRKFGARVIAPIEAAAQRSASVRLAIWSVRHSRQGDGIRPDVPVELWARFQAAAGDTNRCNTRLREGETHRLAPLEEEVVEGWLARQSTFWAWSVLNDLVREEPERAWETIIAVLHSSRTAEERTYCGAGPLEDLIRANPALFIERAEELASRDAAFRGALGAAWITLEDVPDQLARRYLNASGRELKILDAPEGWNPDAPGAPS